MIETNSLIVNFIKNNFLLLIILAVSIFRVIPPEWAGFWKYKNDKESEGLSPRITIINFVLTSLFESVFRSFFIPLIAAISSNTVTLIILIVVIFDIFIRHQISGPAVTLVCVGIVALYLEKLIMTGKIISFFGGLLSWEKDQTTN